MHNATALYAAITLVLLMILGFVLYHRHTSREAYATSHAVGHTMQDLRQIANALYVYSSVQKKALPSEQTKEGAVTLSGRELFSILLHDDVAASLLQGHSVWFQRQTLCDAWTNDIRADVKLTDG